MQNFLLFHRELGLHPPCFVERSISMHRTLSLKLSSKKSLRPPSYVIRSMDIDNEENRYLLGGGGRDYVAIYDLMDPVNQKDKNKIHPILEVNGEGHLHGISAIQWYPHDSGMFFTGSFDKTMRIWDTNEMEVIYTFSFDHHVKDIHMSSIFGGEYLIAVGSSDTKIRICDIRSKTSAHSLIGHVDSVMSIRWSPLSEFILSSGSADGTIRMWDVRKSGCFMLLDQHNSETLSSPKSRISKKKHITNTAHNGTITALTYTPDGRYLLSTGTDQMMRCWNATTGANTMVNYPKVVNRCKKVNKLSVSSNSEIVYHPSGNVVRAYNISTGDLVNEYRGHYGLVSCSIFRYSQQELYTASEDKQILVYSPQSDCDPYENNEEELSDPGDAWSDDELQQCQDRTFQNL